MSIESDKRCTLGSRRFKVGGTIECAGCGKSYRSAKAYEMHLTWVRKRIARRKALAALGI